MANVVLGVGGGIAAYKSCLLLRLFTEAGHRVRVVPTHSALKFVGAPTWEALSGQPVTADVFEHVPEVAHVRIGQQADLVVVAPATADLLAKAAAGIADDLLTNTLLTARCPVLMAPAMHTEMWLHPATQANVATLRERGLNVLDPASGRLTGVDTGLGRLPEPQDIHATAMALLGEAATGEAPATDGSRRDLQGLRVLVSAGGTREALDPVRFLGNQSSGKQGFAIAHAARDRGAQVVLVSANATLEQGGSLTPPEGVEVVPVVSALDLREAMLERTAAADVVIMAAAVADFRPASVAEHKIKKRDDANDAPVVELVRNPDILVELAGSARRDGQTVVGFAAETGDDAGSVLEHGARKLARKRCDLLVVNDVGGGKVFGQAHNAVTILGADGSAREVPTADKRTIADAILDAVVAIR